MHTTYLDDERDEKPTEDHVQTSIDADLVIGDPSRLCADGRDLHASAATFALGDCAGTWHIQTLLDEQGEHVNTLRAHREGSVFPLVGVTFAGPPVTEGRVPVDSGQIYIGCRSSLPLDYLALEDLCAQHPLMLSFGFAGGFVTASGYGDGIYEIDVAREHTSRRPAEISVRFITPA
jgi:hypothetical protein